MRQFAISTMNKLNNYVCVLCENLCVLLLKNAEKMRKLGNVKIKQFTNHLCALCETLCALRG
jgi:hypothetical protein